MVSNESKTKEIQQFRQERAVADPKGARGPNFLNFMQILEKSGKFVCWCPLLRGILDSPLEGMLSEINHTRKCQEL